MTENWRTVVSFEGMYEVSDLGRVRSVPRVVVYGGKRAGQQVKVRGGLRKPVRHSAGYVYVNLCRDGDQHLRLLQWLVLEAFDKARPVGLEACHRNGDKHDNRIANLYWGTHSENIRDAVRHRTHNMVAKDSCPKGHLYDDENTRIYDGRQYCRSCHRDRTREYQRRVRAAERESRKIEEAAGAVRAQPNREAS